MNFFYLFSSVALDSIIHLNIYKSPALPDSFFVWMTQCRLLSIPPVRSIREFVRFVKNHGNGEKILYNLPLFSLLKMWYVMYEEIYLFYPTKERNITHD